MTNIIQQLIQRQIQTSLGCSLPDRGFPWENVLCFHQDFLAEVIPALFLIGLVVAIVTYATALRQGGLLMCLTVMTYPAELTLLDLPVFGAVVGISRSTSE